MDGDSSSESVIVAPLFPRGLVGAISGVLAVVLGYDVIVNGVTPVGIAGAPPPPPHEHSDQPRIW